MFYDIMYVSISERRCKMNFYNKPTNQVIDLSIENTTHESIKDGKFVYNELKVKTLGLSEEQIKNKLDSIFVMNTLKESC